MSVRWIPAAVLLAAIALGGCGDSEEIASPQTTTSTTASDDASAFCSAHDHMLDAQRAWTVEYLVSLTAEEAAENRAEQDAAAAPAEALLPEQFVDEWNELGAVNDRLALLIGELRPPGGTLEPMLEESRRQGFGSVTEFVFGDGIEVDGRTWTFEDYTSAGAALADDIAAFCQATR